MKERRELGREEEVQPRALGRSLLGRREDSWQTVVALPQESRGQRESTAALEPDWAVRLEGS